MRTELLLPQNQTVCIRVKEVQVCCNRWLKRERWLSSFYRTGALFSAESETITFFKPADKKASSIKESPDRQVHQHRRKAGTLSGKDSALLKGKKAPISSGFDSKPRSGTARCHPISIKGRRVTPVFRLRPLQPYVPLRYGPSESAPAMDIL